MKKYLLIFAVLLAAIDLFAQGPAIEWQKSIGGTGNDWANSIQSISDNSYIVAGGSNSNNGDLSGNHGKWDFSIAKLTMSGNILWTKLFGGTGLEYANVIKQTSDGGFIIAGPTYSNNGDVSGNHSGASDYWIVKLDSSGNIQWQKCLGGTVDETPRDIIQTTDGGYMIFGDSSSNNGNVSGNHSIGGYHDVWVVKLNPSGTILWQKCYGGSGQEFAFSAKQTQDGGFIIAGYTAASNDGDVSGNHGHADVWILKINSSGTLQWQKCLGGSANDTAHSIDLTSDGGYIIAGITESNNGDVSGNHGEYDIWVVKLNSNGNILWQRCLGGTKAEYSFSLKSTNDGGYIIAGRTGSTDGDVSYSHNVGDGSYDVWIIKLNSSGNIQWERCYGGTDYESADSIIQTTDGGYIFAGTSQSSDFDVSGNHGSGDIWVVKLEAECTLSPSLDLYIKDSPEDTGVEPNTLSPNSWSSNNIWVRLTNDNGTEHQNPEYNGTSSNYVYVKVTNNSCQASTGNEQLEVYWTNANTASSWPGSWDGTETIDGTLVKGGLAGTVNIPVIQPGAEAIVPIEWSTIPDPEDYEAVGVGEPWHFCLLARINATNDPMTFPETEQVHNNIMQNDNIASKNVNVINVGSKKEISGSVAVYNPYNNSQGFDLVFAADNTETGKKIFQEAEVYVKLSDELYSAWVSGGSQSTSINLSSTANTPLPANTFRITGDNAKLKNLVLDGKESAVMALKFNFLTKEVTSKTTFTYYVTQKKTITNEVIGGNTFIIQKTPRESFQAYANDISANKNEMVTLTVDEINEDAVYNWYDSEGNLIYTGTSLSIIADIAKTYKVEVIAEDDGYKDYTDVEISLNPHSLQSIAPNPSSNNITINYNLNSPNSAYLSITGYVGNETGMTRNYILNTDSSQKDIDISNYATGYYTLALICDGQVVGTINLIKQ